MANMIWPAFRGPARRAQETHLANLARAMATATITAPALSATAEDVIVGTRGQGYTYGRDSSGAIASASAVGADGVHRGIVVDTQLHYNIYKMVYQGAAPKYPASGYVRFSFYEDARIVFMAGLFIDAIRLSPTYS